MSELNAVHLRLMPGRAYPLGAAVRQSGVRFAVVSRHATRVWLALFDNAEDRRAFLLMLGENPARRKSIWFPKVDYLKQSAPPVEGAANAAVIEFFAKALRRPKSGVVLVRGDTSRTKTLEIKGVSVADVLALIAR